MSACVYSSLLPGAVFGCSVITAHTSPGQILRAEKQTGTRMWPEPVLKEAINFSHGRLIDGCSSIVEGYHRLRWRRADIHT